jgi:transposase-like protein
MFSLHRRRAPHRQRTHEIETFRRRSEWLSADDKTLLQMVFEKGSTLAAIARLTGQSPSTVGRRFHRLLRQLIARELVTLLGGRCEAHPADIHLIRDYFLQGQTQKAIARKHNVSLYRVRAVLEAVRSIAYAAAGPAPRPERFGRYHKHTKRNRTPAPTKGDSPCPH